MAITKILPVRGQLKGCLDYAANSEQIQALTARIRELRREITTCADIEMDCEMVQDKVQRAAHRRENPPRERIHRRAY